MNQETTKSSHTTRQKRGARNKKKTFTDRTYGARLPYEDARVLDDYAERNRLDCADVVRLAVKQFAARQELKYQPKDAVRSAVEEVISEQLAPVIALLEKRSPDANPASQADTSLLEHKQLLERALLASTLAMRLLVTYSIEPDLRRTDAQNADEIKSHLLAADSGRDAWCDLTKQVIKRTGQRIIHDLNMRPPHAPTAATTPPNTAADRRDTGSKNDLTEDEITGVLS